MVAIGPCLRVGGPGVSEEGASRDWGQGGGVLHANDNDADVTPQSHPGFAAA